jgi:hypothetical protein
MPCHVVHVCRRGTVSSAGVDTQTSSDEESEAEVGEMCRSCAHVGHVHVYVIGVDVCALAPLTTLAPCYPHVLFLSILAIMVVRYRRAITTL